MTEGFTSLYTGRPGEPEFDMTIWEGRQAARTYLRQRSCFGPEEESESEWTHDMLNDWVPGPGSWVVDEKIRLRRARTLAWRLWGRHWRLLRWRWEHWRQGVVEYECEPPHGDDWVDVGGMQYHGIPDDVPGVWGSCHVKITDHGVKTPEIFKRLEKDRWWHVRWHYDRASGVARVRAEKPRPEIPSDPFEVLIARG